MQNFCLVYFVLKAKRKNKRKSQKNFYKKLRETCLQSYSNFKLNKLSVKDVKSCGLPFASRCKFDWGLSCRWVIPKKNLHFPGFALHHFRIIFSRIDLKNPHFLQHLPCWCNKYIINLTFRVFNRPENIFGSQYYLFLYMMSLNKR